MNNFVEQMSKADRGGLLEGDRQACWSFYKGLGKFDEQKRAIATFWDKNRTLKGWETGYKESIGKESATTKSTVNDWGTK